MTVSTDDYDEIVKVMQLYLDAYNENDISKLRQAFHENAWIYFIDADGALHSGVMCDRVAAQLQNGRLREFVGDVAGRIVSVVQAGDAAAVQLNFDRIADRSNAWIDFHNLLRINGVWKITNKTATHRSR